MAEAVADGDTGEGQEAAAAVELPGEEAAAEAEPEAEETADAGLPPLPQEGEIELAEPPLPETPAVTEAALPEEAVPVAEPPPEPAPEAPPPSEAAAALPPPAASPAPSPPPAPPVPPEPPPGIGPVEPRPPATVREPLPVPLKPPPERPAVLPPPLEEEKPVFSRMVRATKGQLVEIPFRGTGWVYMGELASRRGLSYDSRRLDADGQSFIFRAEAAGTYALKFYKRDFVRDYALNDHVQVIVGEAEESAGTGWFNPPVDRGRVVAEPRWPPVNSAVPASAPETAPLVEAAPAAGAASPEAASPAPEEAAVTDSAATPPSAAASPASAAEAPPPQVSAPEDYLTKAQREFDSGKVPEALAALSDYVRAFPEGSGDAWWLYGQCLEASSPGRNIRLALDYYRRLVNEFPLSPRVETAKQRIAYLERYYFNLR
jgi:hypothetical protein